MMNLIRSTSTLPTQSHIWNLPSSSLRLIIPTLVLMCRTTTCCVRVSVAVIGFSYGCRIQDHIEVSFCIKLVLCLCTSDLISRDVHMSWYYRHVDYISVIQNFMKFLIPVPCSRLHDILPFCLLELTEFVKWLIDFCHCCIWLPLMEF